LDLRNCPLVTDLSILETQTNAGKSSLGTLIINNTSIKLNTIQKTISNLKGGYYWHNDSGLVLADASLYSQLANCTNITYLKLTPSWKNSVGYVSTKVTVDLSNCTSLETFWIYRVNADFTLPSSVTSVTYGYVSKGNGSLDLSACSKLSTLAFSDSCGFDILTGALSSLKNNTSVNKITIYGFTTITDLSFCDDLATMSGLRTFSLTGWSQRLCKVTSLEPFTKLSQITNLTLSYFTQITDLPDMSKMTSLNTLSISYSSLSQVTESANLSKLASLSNVTLNNNNIIDISGLFSCKAMTTLNLQNNCIYDTLMDSTSGKNYNNVSKLAELNSTKGNGGNLAYLYLSGNNIIDFTPVSSLKWSGKSGF
jgi:hypothetical protein